MDLVIKYQDHLSHIKKYSTNTVLAYVKDLNQFFSFCKIEFEIDQWTLVNHFMIRSWIVNMMQDSLVQPRSINRKLSSLNGFFKYLIQIKILSHNPMAKVTGPKVGKRLPDVISEKEMGFIINENFIEKDEFEMTRNILIINLLYHTGMRRTELLNIKDEDVNFARQELRVIGKGKKERLVPLSKAIMDYIKHYITIKNDNITPCDSFLILTKKGKKMNPRSLYNIVHNYLSTVTTSEKKSPHVLRHSFATHLLNHGADINAIKEILGHANLAATQVYTHNSIERLKKVYEKSHPKSN